jgi:hypothetical protein
MTGVLDPTTAAAPRKSLAGDPKTGSGVPNNVRLLDSRRVEVAPLTANADAARPPVLDVAKDALCPAADRERIGVRFVNRIRAWIVVPVVDFALMVAPLAWRPAQIHAVVAMAVLATFLMTGGRYRARLHLSVLDELPTILSRMLTATAAVASVILYMHQREAVLTFLETACQATALVVGGRVITTRLTAFARRRGIVRYHTVLIGAVRWPLSWRKSLTSIRNRPQSGRLRR